jgi:hypothetical protein
MKTSEMFPSRWLKGDDLNGTPTVTISSVTQEVVGQNNEQKHVVWFEGMQKGLILNKTNSDAIEALYGDDTDNWLSEDVTLYAAPVSYNGKVTNACRVRAPKKVQKAQVKKAVEGDHIPGFDDEIPFAPEKR